MLVSAEGRAWEPEALTALADARDLTTVRRCLDVHDLLAVAATGTARAAVVAAPGADIDRDLVERLASQEVATLAVVPDHGSPAAAAQDVTARLLDIGVSAVLTESAVAARLAEGVRDAVSGRGERAAPSAPTEPS